VLAILGSRHDPTAAALLARWGDRAALLGCEDLSAPGWRFEPDRPSDGTAVVAGTAIAVADLEGVLTLRPAVFEAELGHLAADDRPYAAAELSAFLVAWLAALPCRVVNRPSPTSLLGPNWRREQWVQAAVSMGIPAAPTRRTGGLPTTSGNLDRAGCPAGVPVVVVGDRGLGDVAPELVDRAVQLARHANADLLEVWFEHADASARLLDASPCPPLQDPATADALLELLLEQPVQAPRGVA
jgi:hypothetical protein